MHFATINKSFDQVVISETESKDIILVCEGERRLIPHGSMQRPVANGCVKSDRAISFVWAGDTALPQLSNCSIEINGKMYDLKGGDGKEDTRRFELVLRPTINKVWLNKSIEKSSFDITVPREERFDVLLDGVKLVIEGTKENPSWVHGNNTMTVRLYGENQVKMNMLTQQNVGRIVIILGEEQFTLVSAYPIPPKSTPVGYEYAVKKIESPAINSPTTPAKPMTISFAAGPAPRNYGIVIDGFKDAESPVQLEFDDSANKMSAAVMPVDGKLSMMFAGVGIAAFFDNIVTVPHLIVVSINGKRYRLQNQIEKNWPLKFELLPAVSISKSISEEAEKYINSASSGNLNMIELREFLTRLKKLTNVTV